MALKLRKDIKKSSYYVWFLGAKESKGLRGTEYIVPVIKHLEEREKDIEPFKVTLQVSHKGLKIIQNVVSQNQKNSKPKNETIKHFIPHNTITCVYQQEDVIACILLLFNPVTKCPLHVHAYRCDSLETATLLKIQLQTLIERPENQKKFAEIESKLKPQKELKKVDSSIGSDTGTSTRESESSEERYAVESTRVTTLYDSVAAELRAKLGKKNSPILLPPRDYDTVHRTKGNLTGIELRRCLNANIVGQNVKGRRIESSGGSSGIGSDHPPSPESPDAPDSRFNTLDNQSTSDEDWNGDPAESTIYLMHQPAQIASSKQTRDKSPDNNQRFSRYAESHSPKYEELNFRSSKNVRDETQKYLEKPISKYADNKFLERQKSLEKEMFAHKKFVDRQRSLEKDVGIQRSFEQDRRSGNFEKYGEKRYYYQGEDSREKFDRFYESEKSRQANDDFSPRKEKSKQQKYFEDDGFDENMRYRNKSTDFERNRSRYTYEEEEYFDNRQYKEESAAPKIRQRYPSDDSKFYKGTFRSDGSDPKSPTRSSPDDSRYYTEPEIKPRSLSRPSQKDNYSKSRSDREEKSVRSQELFEDHRKIGQFRSPTPSSDDIKAPSDRFKNAKEKFMLMERERLEIERRRPEPPISPTNVKEKPFSKRYNDSDYPNDRERYFNDHRGHHLEDPKPTPAPRHISEEVRYRERNREMHRDRDPPMDRYRQTDKFDPKRRSMFSLIEEEHRKNSNEIAKELKRRSYMDSGGYDEDIERLNRDRDRHFQELPESDRFLDGYSKSSIEIDKVGEMKFDQKFIKNQKQVKNSAGYRHSYVEPKMRMDKNTKKHLSEMLHRTNSSVGNNGRVGIASVHPY
ncbi:trichohyalin [Diorhabda sublineata]|uniref:trichohyalin n=1 Tax=Diorhabda sublineata TaxID=1163346 RepID=UPI0024E1923C|nr:trichohyalin [Diorhabda sublineata]